MGVANDNVARSIVELIIIQAFFNKDIPLSETTTSLRVGFLLLTVLYVRGLTILYSLFFEYITSSKYMLV